MSLVRWDKDSDVYVWNDSGSGWGVMINIGGGLPSPQGLYHHKAHLIDDLSFVADQGYKVPQRLYDELEKEPRISIRRGTNPPQARLRRDVLPRKGVQKR